jgi:hypothetical protein
MLALSLAISIVIILFIITYGAVCKYDEYLSGFWVGNSTFLKKSKLEDFQLFIAPYKNKCRQGYLIMIDENGEFVSNQVIEIKNKSNWWDAFKSLYKKTDIYKIDHVELKYDAEPSMPKTIKMSLSILNGTLTLYDDKKVYAFMEKDLSASAIALKAYSAY